MSAETLDAGFRALADAADVPPTVDEVFSLLSEAPFLPDD